MKRCFAIFILLALMLSISACSKISVTDSKDVTLTFIHGEENVIVTLEDDEAEKILSIFNENSYEPLYAGNPSCSFSKNISLKIGDRVFAIARDECNFILDASNMRYFDVSQEDMDYVHSLFEKYGGYFPCV